MDQDQEQANREYKERCYQREREEIVKLQADNLMAQWEVVKAAEAASDAASVAYSSEKSKYADMLAEALGIKIGMRVTRTLRVSYVRDKETVKTYEVTKYALGYSSATTLNLWGRTVKRDGKLGEIFDIGTDWERA